jgi:hypothetical protein
MSSMSSRARASRRGLLTPWTASGKRDVAEHRQMRQKREVLEHHAHLVAADVDELRIAGLEEVAAVQHDAAKLGSIRRDRQRTSVDLPEPDRPMTMKISPSCDSSG